MSEQKLYIGNLPYRTNEGDVREYLRGYGPIYSIILIYDPETGRTKGYGFVELEDTAAEAVLRDLNDTKFMGRNLKIRRANQQFCDAGVHGVRDENPRGRFGEYVDFNQEDFDSLNNISVDGKYYEIDPPKHRLYQAYKFTGNQMEYSGPSKGRV